MRVLLVCDRSGGHIFPALAIAKKIQKDNRDSKIYFFATSDFLKSFLLRENFCVYGKSFSQRNLIGEMAYRIFEALYLIFKIRPKKMIGFGGRDSFFLILFGSLLHIDSAIYEPNVKFGKANFVLSWFVKKVFCGFNKLKDSRKFIVTGIPLRENIKKIERKQALLTLGLADKPTIFCFGGSQGSSFLNDVFTRLVETLEGDFQCIHLTGKREYFKIVDFYNKMDKRSFVRDFYFSMETLYSAADVVVGRAGASALAEIAYYNLPSVLIPHPAAGGHQKENALYFEDRHAAYVVLQNDFDFDDFKSKVKDLIYDFKLRDSMKNNLQNIKVGMSFEEFCKNTYF